MNRSFTVDLQKEGAYDGAPLGSVLYLATTGRGGRVKVTLSADSFSTSRTFDVLTSDNICMDVRSWRNVRVDVLSLAAPGPGEKNSVTFYFGPEGLRTGSTLRLVEAQPAGFSGIVPSGATYVFFPTAVAVTWNNDAASTAVLINHAAAETLRVPGNRYTAGAAATYIWILEMP